MRWLAWIIGILVVILVCAYVLLFTGFGNGILKPVLQSNIQKNTPVDAQLEDFSLTPSKLKIKLVLASTSVISAEGTYSIFPKNADINYEVNVADLSVLKAYTKQLLQGPFSTKGSIKGDAKKMLIKGDGKIKRSKFDYDLALKDLQPQTLKADASMKLEEILYLVAQPKYAKADINIKADMKSLDISSMGGAVDTNVRNGIVDSILVKRDFNITLPPTSFKADADTNINNSVAVTKSNIFTTIAKLNTKKSVFDIKSGNLDTDYTAIVSNLNDLYFLTKRKLKGSLKVEGDVKKDKKHLEVTARSDILGGRFDARMVDNKLTSVIKGFQTTALTDMLMMQKIFSSTMNADINYNIKDKKGVLNAELLNGKILPNKMSMLLNQMAQFDITKEVYEKTELQSKINDMVILSDLAMKSSLTDIKSKDALVDLNKNLVDAKLDLMVKEYPVPVAVKGDLNSPKVSVDAKKMLQGKAKAEISKKIDEKLGDKVPEKTKGLLKKFFK